MPSRITAGLTHTSGVFEGLPGGRKSLQSRTTTETVLSSVNQKYVCLLHFSFWDDYGIVLCYVVTLIMSLSRYSRSDLDIMDIIYFMGVYIQYKAT